jgi:hypothetical protein
MRVFVSLFFLASSLLSLSFVHFFVSYFRASLLSLFFSLLLSFVVCFPVIFPFFVYVSLISLCLHSFLVPFFLTFLSSSVSERNGTADSLPQVLRFPATDVDTCQHAAVTVIAFLHTWLLRALLAVAENRYGVEC